MDPLLLPSTLDEAESLILSLYQSAAPETIAGTQEVLQRLQRSPSGWQFAHGMLGRSHDQVKFFGALTIIIKLNTESSTLSDDDANELLHNLIGWFVRSLTDGSATLVIRKLCSALVAFFIQFDYLWPECMRHLVYCLDVGHAASIDDARNAPTSDLVASLDDTKLLAAVWFATAWVEETSKTDMNSQKYNLTHKSLMAGSGDVVTLLARGLTVNSPNSIRIQDHALKCLQAWVTYEQRAPSTDHPLLPNLRSLVVPALSCIQTEDLSVSTMELFIDILQNYSGFLTPEHYEALFTVFESPWSQHCYTQLIEGDFDFVLFQYGVLSIAFGDAKLQTLMEGTEERSQRMLQRLCGLLNCNGYLGTEDKIFVPALEFWATFVETMTDTVYTDEDSTSTWVSFAMSQVMDAVSHCYRKIQMIDSAYWSEMDSTDRAGWSEARMDVTDFLQAVFALKGKSLVKIFVDLLVQSLPIRHWAQVEASVFCLGAISDCLGDDGGCDQELDLVFSSELFQLMSPVPGKTDIPARLLQTSLSLIERYSDFFERHQQYLPAALNLLFGVIGEDGSLGGSSSRSIMKLCSSCRSLLQEHIEGFLEHYQRIHSLGVDPIAEERIMAGIASIIQAVPEETQRLGYLEQLVSVLYDDAQCCLSLKDSPEIADEVSMKQWLERRLRVDIMTQKTAPSSAYEASSIIAERVLRCLASMAKGLQSLSEGPIDLDAETANGVSGGSQRLVIVQNQILTIINGLHQGFGHTGAVTSIICNIFRAGFSETQDGPFVFPPGTIIEFFTRQTSQYPRIGTMIRTVCSFVSSVSNRPKALVVECLSSLLPWVINLLKEMPEPDSDTELTQNAIEFVHRVMLKNPEVLLQLQPTSDLEFFFYFALKVLDGKEPLSKVSAADFWSAFVALKSEDPAVQADLSNAIVHLGPLLARSLIFNVGGNASRSELDKLSDPLRKLVVSHPRSQQWLETALCDPAFPSTQVTQGDKSTFLKKIISLRGARQTNQVVREFWLACRGSSFSYVS